MIKAVFLDRDGTINVDHGYVCRPEDMKLIPGALKGLQRLKKAGYLCIVVTNQSGIGRGYYTLQDYHETQKQFEILLKNEGMVLDAVYYCPHSPESGCDCRKPETGMLDKAFKDFSIHREGSFMIGDKSSDIEAGRKAGLQTILISHENKPFEQTITFPDLAQASDWILDQKSFEETL